jgi:alkylation response protein AidB-like acyl-CoA dehydrogenase
MYLFFNEEHELIREMARDYANKALAPIAAEIDRNDKFPEEVLKQMGAMGLYGLKTPEEYGGMGLDTRSYVCVMEEISKKCATAAVPISSSNSLASIPILLSGTDEQKQKYLPEIASGAAFNAFGLTEPDAGSDAASLSTSAVKDGGDYILNGQKRFISLAPIAKYCTIYARTEPNKGAAGISAFLIDMALPGVSVGKPEEKMGQRGIPVSDVILDDVRVPESCMLGEANLGFINAMKTLSVGRIGIAAMSLGIAQEALDLAIEYTKNRVQFGKPIAKNQGIQFMLADMETQLNASRLLVYNAAWMMDNGYDVTKEAAVAKYFATEAGFEIVNKSLQLHGGYGYSQEYAVERLLRDIRICSIYEGSSQVLQMVISGKILK